MSFSATEAASGASSSVRWPDFYALLGTTPEADSKTLRRQINLLYDRADSNNDHRELKKRFYFQLLSHKVLPQCRRILLDATAREAYDEQRQLHVLGASDALTYTQFMGRLRRTHENIASGLSLLDQEELKWLPAVIVDQNCLEAEIPTQLLSSNDAPEDELDSELGNAATVVIRDLETPDAALSADSMDALPRTESARALPVAAAAGAGIEIENTVGARSKSRSKLPFAALGGVALMALIAWIALGRGGQNEGQSESPGFAVSPDQQANWKPVGGYIMTDWAKKVAPDKVLPEYPRPQMAREKWRNLNGLWNYALTDKAAINAPQDNDGQILVPYPYESALSGVGKKSIPDKKLWYRRSFTIPADWDGQRVILHFGAVNWEAKVKVNGKPTGSHKGGYDAFEFDITDALQSGENTLEVAASNPIDDEGGQVLGKQRKTPSGIWYSASTGIWQTVWLEPVPTVSIQDLQITPDIDDNTLSVNARIAGAPGAATAGATIQIEALDGGRTLAKKTGAAGQSLALAIPNPKLWTPDAPKLYDLRVSLLQNGAPVDKVISYFAMRKTSVARDAKGALRLMLNNRFQMQYGVLDQGYWPDGLYTAPTDEALASDIVMAKKLGFNMMRKHAKVEPARWYYHADKLGVLVWQDMPQMFANAPAPDVAAQFQTEWKRIIEQHRNAPSIVVWTLFNEGWGQHATSKIVEFTRSLDKSRPVNEASGWNDAGSGDIADFHNYPTPKTRPPDNKRATVNGEFGGLGLAIADHVWNTDTNFDYGKEGSTWDLTRSYQKIMQQANALRDSSQSSAFVYTQLTDVEQETNGLMTYDRKIVKPTMNVAAAATRGKFVKLPPNPFAEIITTSRGTAHVWAYATDKPADNWAQTSFDSKSWKKGAAGFGATFDATKGNGVRESKIRTNWNTPDIWIRREIELPANLPPDLSFLCAHDEDIEIYINGVLAAQAPQFTTSYAEIPLTPQGRAAIKPGKNILAAHCHQTTGDQYLDFGIIPAK